MGSQKGPGSQIWARRGLMMTLESIGEENKSVRKTMDEFGVFILDLFEEYFDVAHLKIRNGFPVVPSEEKLKQRRQLIDALLRTYLDE